MLKIYAVILELVRELKPVMLAIERNDSDLARQMRKASSSVVLNVAEGSRSLGGNKRVRYYSALGSAQETKACVDVAEVLGYVEPLDAAMLDRFDHVIGTLVRLAK